MSNVNQLPILAGQNYQLIRKKRLLEKVPFSKSTLHAKMAKGAYQDPTFPRPIYFPNSRIPYWREAAIDEWIALAERRSCQGSEVLGEPAHTAPPARYSSSAPQAQPVSQPARAIPPNRNAVRGLLSRTGDDGLLEQSYVETRRERAAMPVTVAPVVRPLADVRDQEVDASLVPEFWTHATRMEASVQAQPTPSLTTPYEVTPVYSEYAGYGCAPQFAPGHPPAPAMLPMGLI